MAASKLALPLTWRAKPADLPVEQPIKFYLVLNLKMAKQLGITITSEILLRATRVIR